MKQQTLFVLIFSIIFIVLLIFLFIFPYNLNQNKIPDNYVTEVIDGDTFKIHSGEIIRLLCVDTPESSETNYEEAKLFLKSLILNKEVNLTASITNKDVYNRLLRYVYVDDKFVNKLVFDNYGKLLVIPPETCELLLE